MPLLHKKPFVPIEFPIDLRDSEEVFFCKTTHEIFRDYDEFCERIILCNSLVWSCSLTGRSHLTYKEAAASEEKVKRLLKKFPLELRIPVLYLSSICERRSLIDLAEEVFLYVKDRFFIGETVQVNSPDGVRTCHILSVIPPTTEELEASNHTLNGDRHWPPAFSFKYEVERLDNNEELVVTAGQIFRKKTSYNKDKNRLYIKQFVHLENGIWKLKENSSIKYGINKVRYDQIFCGEPPDMNPKNTPVRKATKKQETLNKYFKPAEKKAMPAKKISKKSETLSAKQKRGRRTKKDMKVARTNEGSTSERKRLKSVRVEERMKYAEFVKEWNMEREDLECEDLKEMPTAVPVQCRLPNEYFGDVIMIMEFLNAFSKVIPVKDFFPNRIPFELLERALVDNEIAGPFCDIIQLLLTVIFDLQDQEVDENKENEKITPGLVFERGDNVTLHIIKEATEMDVWVKKHHGIQLSRLPLDTSTISEILRLHLLCSGSKAAKSKLAKWRYQSRGGYCSNDDPGVILKRTNFQIIEELGSRNVCDLDIKDKIDILNCLTNQILTYASLRDIIEEGCDKARQIRVELRSVRAAETRRGKEEASRQRELKKDNSTLENGLNDSTNSKHQRGNLPNSEKKEEQLCKDIREALAGAQLAPLGTDRAHRRFWVFASMPGLFVEHYDDHYDRCLPKGTPVVHLNHSTTDGDNLAYIRRLFEESGNKENFAGTTQSVSSLVSPAKKLLVEKNGADTPIIGRSRTKSESSTQNFTCWGDPINCPVHGSAVQRITWSFFHTPAQIDLLIDSLNRRGMRERKLRQALIQEKASIVQQLEKCPVNKLNSSLSQVNGEDKRKFAKKLSKQYDNANLNYPAGTPPDLIMENTLRDLIIETEEKINCGALGMIKVRDRLTWKKAILNQSYDKQCSKLTWGSKINDVEEDPEIKEEILEDNIKKEDESSRSSTPSIDDLFTYKGVNTCPQRPVINDLASAILQVEQGIDQKYLKRPLGLDKKERDRGELKTPTPMLERWENALMNSTNFPQLFLHLTILENSVTWEKSALNAFCRICRKRNDPENMLLCDTCNKGHHLYCLKPKLTRVPSGDWHCPQCRPKQKVESVRKKRRLFSEEESDNEEKEEWICKTCSENNAQLVCHLCVTYQHLTCVVPPMRKVPKSKWFCHDCRQQNAAAMQKESQKDTSTVIVENGPPTPPKEEELSISSRCSPERKPNNRSNRKSASKVERTSNHVALDNDDDYVVRSDDNDDDDDDVDVDSANSQNGNNRNDDVRWQMNASLIETERTSRRRSSKAATVKISQFAKQLRSNGWDDEDDYDINGDGRSSNNESITTTPVRRSGRESISHKRSRHHVSWDLPLDNAALLEILDHLMHHEAAWPFLRPVTRSEVPDYHQIIKKPMDLATIKHKLNMLSYSKNSELVADTELMFDNCNVYNDEGSEVYSAGVKLRKLFYKLCKKHNIKLNDSKDGTPPLKRARTVL